jgi:hypothetical protein
MKTKAKKKRLENRINDYTKMIATVRNSEAFTKPGSLNK